MAKADIFVSYSRKDHELVAKLVYLLEWYGYSVWWDIESLRSGEDFSEVIRRTINDVKCVVVIWSGSSVKSQWVKAEAQPALETGKLAPFVIDRDAVIPLPFNSAHSESLEGWSGDPQERQFYRVLEAVGRFCPQPSKQAFVPRTSKELHSAFSAPPSPVSAETQELKEFPYEV